MLVSLNAWTLAEDTTRVTSSGRSGYHRDPSHARAVAPDICPLHSGANWAPPRPRRLAKLGGEAVKGDPDLIFALVAEAGSMATARSPQPALCMWRSRHGGWGGEGGGGSLRRAGFTARETTWKQHVRKD